MSSGGPDASGEWYSSDSAAGLAHRRLSIIDLNIDANQPMVCTGSGLTILFNGEIYNHLELRQELTAAGLHFTTQSDTEVLLQAYADWGADCLKHLRGMYAFAIWDDQEKCLFLARDPYGIKPLYYVCVRRSSAWYYLSVLQKRSSRLVTPELGEHYCEL